MIAPALELGPDVDAFRGDDGSGAGHRFEKDEAEVFLAGGEDEEVGGLVE